MVKKIVRTISLIFLFFVLHFQLSLGQDISTSVEINGDAGWRMLSAPITNFVVDDISDNTAIQGVTGGPDENGDPNFYIYPDAGATSLILNPEFTPPDDMSTPWEDGWGFIVYFYDNSQNNSSPLPITLDAEGDTLTTDLTVDVNQEKFTLVGNPFHRNMELDSLKGNGKDGTSSSVHGGLISPIHVWQDSSDSEVASNGYYEVYNFDEGVVIPEWQGFFLESADNDLTTGNEGAENVTIPLEAKTSVGESFSHFDSKNKHHKPIPRLVKMELHGPEGAVDKAIQLYFTPSGRETVDGFDGSKLRPLTSHYATLAFVQNLQDTTRLLTQDARPYDPETVQKYNLDLSTSGLSGEFTITWPTWRNMPDHWSVTLYDRVTDKTIDMRNTDEYTFSYSESTQKNSPAAKKDLGNPPYPRVKPLTAKHQKSSNSGRFEITVDPTSNEEIPQQVVLHQNFPNPFNPNTVIKYEVPKRSKVELSIYNIMGKKIRTIVEEQKNAGLHRVTFNGSNLASGVYFYQLVIGESIQTKKMLLIK